jgi:hypothetical protein
MTLKTTVEVLDELQSILPAPLRVRDIHDVIHDAREAHWYRLVAWGLQSGRLRFNRNARELSDTAMGGVIRAGGGWQLFLTEHPLDADGLPVRTPELESALRQAMEER